jgi:hypothetical protein
MKENLKNMFNYHSIERFLVCGCLPLSNAITQTVSEQQRRGRRRR